MIKISIDNQVLNVQEGLTILQAARENGIYIPALCSHPDLKPFRSLVLSEKIYQGDTIYENDSGATMESIFGCGVCAVEIVGEAKPLPSCKTEVKDGMVILSSSDKIKDIRRKKLMPILEKHPHSCLTCEQREGCITVSDDCSNSVAPNERCCELNGNCELQRLVDYIGIAPETPKYHHKGIPRIEDGGLFVRDYNLCISCGRCVRACQQLRDVYAMGAVISGGMLRIGSVNGPTLRDADCRFCGACVEVCPTGALQDKDKVRLKSEDDYVPCKANCPGDTQIPLYLKHISSGNYQKAAEVLSSRLSFPHSLGKICFHPCETECRRNELSNFYGADKEAINIRSSKDFAMLNSNLKDVEIKEASGKNVSVIGAGPAGLTAGYFLALKGHKITVYEKERKIGGMLRYGIPRYRLEENILEKDLSRLLSSGMEIKCGISVGRDIKISELLNNESDAAFIATGLPNSRGLPVFTPDHENIHFGVEFLNKVAKNEVDNDYFKSKNVIIIGGGNVATDAARTALRLGARNVTMICLEQTDEMPAYDNEIFETLEEGTTIKNGWGIESFIEVSSGIEIGLKKCISVFDSNGAFSPEYNDNIKEKALCDSVILCIGQLSDFSFLDKSEKEKLNVNGLLKTKDGSLETNIPGLFAGGDIVYGPKSVIDAIGSGKQAAREIDKFLGGDGTISGDEKQEFPYSGKIGKIPGFCHFERIEPHLADPNVRITNFKAVEYSFDEEFAKYEAGRCLQCNLRMNIRQNPYPPEKYLDYTNDNVNLLEEKEGVIQLLNAEKEVFLIKGSSNIKNTLNEFFDEGKEAVFFTFEYDPLFSKRESELTQQYLQKHGEMPDSGDDLDDLF